MEREALAQMLLDIDEEAYLTLDKKDIHPQVVLVGGAAFLLRRITSRQTTHDVDVYRADEAVSKILERYPALNGGVAAYSDQIPYNFEDRLAKLDLDTRTIEFVTPSIEDLVVMKLYAERPNDVQDIDGAVQSGRLDWDKLEHLVYGDNEAKASALSDKRYREMTEAYERLKARYGR